jgi:tetratricopeptide (TPR) repeat protein
MKLSLTATAVALLCLPAATSAQRAQLTTPLNELVARAERDSNDAPAHYEVALGYWLHKKYDKAEHHLRQAILIEPKTASAYLALSFLPFARREKLWDEVEDGKVPAEWAEAVNEALALRRKAFLLDPMVDLRPLALMIPSANSLGLNRAGRAAYTYFMNGLGSFWVGDYVKAYGFFRELAAGSSEEEHQKYSSWFLWYESLAAAHAGDHPRAIANMRTLLKRWEELDERSGGATLAFSSANHYRYALGCLLDQAGQTAEAVTLLQEVLTVDAGLYAAHVRLADVYERNRRPSASLAERRRAVDANPEDPSLLADLGEAQLRAGQLPEAQGTLRLAAQANPRSHRTLYLLGQVAKRLGATEEARSAWTRFLALAPSRWEEQRQEVQQQLATLN